MPANTDSLVADTGGKPAPQFYNDITDSYEYLIGHDGSMGINSLRRKFRDDFTGSSLNTTANWVLVQTGTGMTVTVSSSNLTIATGTTTNQETIIKSQFTVTIPVRIQATMSLSQRIANQEFYIELVDAAGTNYARWLFDGTSATSAKMSNANTGTGPTDSSVTITTTASSCIYELDIFTDEIYFNDRTLSSNATRNTRGLRSEKLPDPNGTYYIQIRAKNLGSAPGSTTSFIIDAISIQDIQELTAEITGGRGSSAAAQTIAVHTTNSATPLHLTGVVASAQTVKASAGLLYGIVVGNPSAALAYLQVFNATAPTVGTTVPLLSIPIPTGQTVVFSPDVAANFTTAITVAGTTTPRGSTAPATGLEVNALYL